MFQNLNKRKRKKALNLIITTSLIIIVSITLLIAFQIWSRTLIEKTKVKVDSLLDKPFTTQLLTIESGIPVLYVQSQVKISSVKLKILSENGDLVCTETISLNKGSNEIKLNNCNNIEPGSNYKLIYLTNKQTINEEIFVT
jgi:hypothetical protein